MLTTLHSVKHILNKEECRSVAKNRLWWDGLALVLAAKPPVVVQETLGMLEKDHEKRWYGDATNAIKRKFCSLTCCAYIDCAERCLSICKHAICRLLVLPWFVYIIMFCMPMHAIAIRVCKYQCCYTTYIVLSNMYQDKLVDDDDIAWMKGKDGYLPDRVVHLQCSKHPEMMTRSANALGMFGYYDSANQLRGWCGWVGGRVVHVGKLYSNT